MQRKQDLKHYAYYNKKQYPNFNAEKLTQWSKYLIKKYDWEVVYSKYSNEKPNLSWVSGMTLRMPIVSSTLILLAVASPLVSAARSVKTIK